MASIQPIVEAVRRFSRDAKRDGERVVAWPTIDPTFRIHQFEAEGDHVLLYGEDERGHDAMLVLPAAQFAICMVSEPGNPERGSFGFVSGREPAP